MKLSSAYAWRKYKADFLRHNRCTVDEFETDYIAFQERKPTINDYRQFASKYGISIIAAPNIPADIQVVLSVNISAMKVMAETYDESLAAVYDILASMRRD